MRAGAAGYCISVAPTWRIWTALAIVYVVWGSTYLAIRIVVETMPPLLTSGVRFTLAGLVMLAAVALYRGGLRIRRAELLPAAVIGAALVAGGNGLVMVAEESIPSALAALIMAAIPLWVVAMRGARGERVPWATLGGVVLGFAGIALLLLPGSEDHGGDLGGLLLCVAASFSWALGTFLSRGADLPDDPFVSTGLQMLLGGGVSLLAGLAAGEAPEVDPAGFSGDSMIAFAYLVVAGSLVAFTAYVWVLQHAPVSQVSTYAYVNPVIAIFLGWSILSEEITPVVLLAAAIVLSSVAVIVRREAAGAEPEPAA